MTRLFQQNEYVRVDEPGSTTKYGNIVSDDDNALLDMVEVQFTDAQLTRRHVAKQWIHDIAEVGDLITCAKTGHKVVSEVTQIHENGDVSATDTDGYFHNVDCTGYRVRTRYADRIGGPTQLLEEDLRAREAPLVDKARKLTVEFGEAWKRVGHLIEAPQVANLDEVADLHNAIDRLVRYSLRAHWVGDSGAISPAVLKELLGDDVFRASIDRVLPYEA